MMICIGGVCVPLNLLLPFLVGVLHRYGWFNWFQQEWVTISFWKKQYAKWTAPAEPSVPTETTGVKAAEKELLADTKQVNAAVEAAVEDTAKDSQVDRDSSLRRREGKGDVKGAG